MDIHEKDKELLFLRDTVNQLKMQLAILQKGLQKKQNNKRYTLREKLFIICPDLDEKLGTWRKTWQDFQNQKP